MGWWGAEEEGHLSPPLLKEKDAIANARQAAPAGCCPEHSKASIPFAAVLNYQQPPNTVYQRTKCCRPACACRATWTLRPHPGPPSPTRPRVSAVPHWPAAPCVFRSAAWLFRQRGPRSLVPSAVGHVGQGAAGRNGSSPLPACPLGADIVLRLLTMDPKRRPTTEELLKVIERGLGEGDLGQGVSGL